MRSRVAFCTAALAALASAFACSTFDNNPSSTPPPEEDSGTADAIVGSTDETFTFGEVKEKVNVVQGKSKKLTLSVTRTPGLQRKSVPIEIKLVDPPPGLSLLPAKVSPEVANTEVELVAANDAKHGEVKLRFEGVVQGTDTRATRDVTTLVRGPTGSLDTTFATDGVQKAVFGVGPNAFFQKAFVMADGRTLVAAETTNASGYALARLDANGKLDPTYGDGGRFYVTEYNTANVAMAPDGTVYLIGYHADSFETRFCRITPSGKRDTALSQTGCVAVDVFGGGMALAPDGNIVVAGSDTNGNIQVAKVTTSGAIVTSFGTQGKTTVKFGAANDYVERLVVRPDGRVLATDRTTETSGRVFQLTAGGVIDPSFTVAQINLTQSGTPLDLFLQADGRFVVSRAQNSNTILDGYKENGQVDPTFVGSGFPGVDGTILLGSLVRTPSGHIAFMTCKQKLFRVDDKGVPDPTLPSAGLPLAVDPEPDAGIDPVKPCGPLIPFADDRFLIPWVRKVGTPDKFDTYVARIWN